MHGAKKKEEKTNFGGLLAILPPERNVTWFFDGLQYYEWLPIHPPNHGLPANCRDRQLAVVVTCLCVGGSCALHSRSLLFMQNLRCARWSSSTPERPIERRTILTGNVVFFCINTNTKRSKYIGQSDATTTKLAKGSHTALWATCCGSCCYELLQYVLEVSPYGYCCHTCLQLASMLVVHIAALTPYVRVSSHLKHTTTSKNRRKVTWNDMDDGHRKASTAEYFAADQPHSSMPAAEAAWVSAAVLKPAPKAEEAALLLGFVPKFCYVKISCFRSFVTKRLAVGNLCHEVVGYRR